jgi:hypothetical protein
MKCKLINNLQNRAIIFFYKKKLQKTCIIKINDVTFALLTNWLNFKIKPYSIHSDLKFNLF